MVDESPPPPDRDGLAAELALGLLEGAERAKALRLCLSNPAFAAEVEAWKLRLSPLLSDTAEVAPSGAVWRAVEARIAGGGEISVARSLRRWRAGALLSGAIAASLALMIVMRPSDAPRPAPGPVAVSQLASAQNADTMAIAYDPAKGMLRLSPTSLETAGKSPELWVIPGDGVPRSLGIIRANGRELAVDGALRRYLTGGVTLAITLEDAATAPHRAPNAPPILTGKITVL